MVVTQSCLVTDSATPQTVCSPPGSSIHGILQTRILEWVAIPFSRESFQPRDQSWASCIAVRFFSIWATSEICSVMSDSLWPHGLHSPWNSPGQNIGVGSLSLLQGIFPTQGSNPSLLLCRQILYHLSHQRSPFKLLILSFTSLFWFLFLEKFALNKIAGKIYWN